MSCTNTNCNSGCGCSSCCPPVTPPTPPTPPTCVGTPCTEFYNGACVDYTGIAIPCLGVLPNTTLNAVIQAMATKLCACCPAFNFDVTANWNNTTPVVTDAATFKTFLQSGKDGTGTNTNNLTSVVITDFSLVSGRLKCNVTAAGDNLYLSTLTVTSVVGLGAIPSKYIYLNNNSISNINSVVWSTALIDLRLNNNTISNFNPVNTLPATLRNLYLNNNSIVNFNPSNTLPALTSLDLSSNSIVNFNPSVSLPSSLLTLKLTSNQIIIFNPTIGLPSGLSSLLLNLNQMITTGYTASLPWATAMTVISGRGTIVFTGNINSITGTTLSSTLGTKGWTVTA